MKFDTAELEGDVQRIALEGRLDIDGSQAIDARFSFMATGRKGNIVVDLAGVRPHLPKAFARYRGDRVDVIAGTYRVGFGQRRHRG